MIEIARLLLSAVSALIGGAVGGWLVAYRMGQWRAQVESRLDAAERRLTKGDRHVDAVPVLQARLDTVIEELRALRSEMREDRSGFVSHEECDRRHGREGGD